MTPADGTTYFAASVLERRQVSAELLTSACPHTAMLMGLEGPTSEDHIGLTAYPRGFFVISDAAGDKVELNQETAVMMAKAILREAGQ